MKNWKYLACVLGCFFWLDASSFAQNYRIIAVQGQTNKVVEINTTNGSVSVLFDLPFTASTSDGVDYNPADGFVYVAHSAGGGQVDFYRLNLAAKTATIAKTISGTGDGSAESIGFTREGNVYVYDERRAFDTGTLYFVNWTNGSVQALGSSQTPSILGGDYDRGRNVFWASDEWSGRVYQLSVTNSSILWTSQSTWFPGIGPGNLLDMDVAPNGDILVGATDETPGVFRILKLDPVTGLWTNFLALPFSPSIDYRFTSMPAGPPAGPRTTISKAIRLDHQYLDYQLQFSYDLNGWTNFGAPFTATSTTNSQYLDVGNWNEFFRLLQVP